MEDPRKRSFLTCSTLGILVVPAIPVLSTLGLHPPPPQSSPCTMPTTALHQALLYSTDTMEQEGVVVRWVYPPQPFIVSVKALLE